MITKLLALIERIMRKFYPVASTDNSETVLPINDPVVPATQPVVCPLEPVITESTPKPTLEAFALAIRDFEGKPGDQNWRLNNPGNARWNPGGYLSTYGKVGKSKNGFAIFKDYDTGWRYLLNMLRGQIHKRPNSTILEFMTRYAPPEDANNPKIYANFIAKRLGVQNSYKMGNLV